MMMMTIRVAALVLLVVLGTSVIVLAADPSTQQWCDQSAGVSTYFGKVSTGSLVTSSIESKCALPQFVAVPGQSSSGTLQFNLKGDYVYTAPASTQVVDAIFVDVFCFNNKGVSTPLCRETFVAQVAAPMTLAPSSAPATTQAATVATCPVVYHFTAVTGTVLSGSLKTAVGQPSCPYGSWYEVGRLPNFGSVNLVASGDFSYTAPQQQTWDDFSYTLYCFNEVLCRGSAYVLVSGTAAPASNSPAAPPGGAGGGGTGGGGGGASVSTATLGQTCTDTCMLDTWKATPSSATPNWDTTRNTVSGVDESANQLRKNDGVTVGTVRASYSNGSVVLVVFGKIGNLGQRFPTFEPVEFRSGEAFSARNVLDRVSRTSVAFNVDCLNKQPDYGMGEEVWHWTSLKNRTGVLGPLHDSQGSWYQKFGGGHQRCDTFRSDSCKYAPLLTPNAKQDPATGGVWRVDIDGCDVTWTGRFSLAAIRSMRKKDGSPVFSIADGSTVRTTLYLQGVQPTSWLQPIMGYASDLIAKPLVMRLDPDVRVQLSGSAKKLFTIDSSFRTFREPSSTSTSDKNNGDFTFALDLRLYPHVAAGATSSYKAERHVSGFRWISQQWTTPDRAGCPSCTGTEPHCTSDPRAPTGSFFSAEGGKSSCSNPVVQITKGPSMTSDSCLHNLMYIFDRPGLSMPRACATTFQNLTLRGVAPGSGQARTFFGFEGQLELQLLLDTGVSVSINVEISRFVSMMSVDGSGITGKTRMCRSSEYWPVLDPLGTSLPIRPFFLSEWAREDADFFGARYLCEAQTRTFGPTTWATVMLDLDKTERVVIESLSIEFEAPHFAHEVIYFLNRDPVTGRPSKTLPNLHSGTKNGPNKKSVWWHESYPFFNFRDLAPLLSEFNETGEVIDYPDEMEGDVTAPIDYAIALTPGAIDVTTSATLTWSARLREKDGSLGGHVTLRTQMVLDELLSDRDVGGLHLKPHAEVAAGSGKTTYIAIFVSGGLIVGVIAVMVIFAAVDTSKPLPTWIPNAHELRDVIMRSNSTAIGDQEMTKGRSRGGAVEIDGVKIVPISSESK